MLSQMFTLSETPVPILSDVVQHLLDLKLFLVMDQLIFLDLGTAPQTQLLLPVKKSLKHKFNYECIKKFWPKWIYSSGYLSSNNAA